MGEDHPDTLLSLSGLSASYRGLGDYAKAAKLSEQCYETGCRVLGKEHRFTLSYLNIFAGTLYDLGEKERALKLLDELYETMCRIANGRRKEELDHYREMLDRLPLSGEIEEVEITGENLTRMIQS